MLKRLIEWFKTDKRKKDFFDFPIEKPKPRPQVKKATTRKTYTVKESINSIKCYEPPKGKKMPLKKAQVRKRLNPTYQQRSKPDVQLNRQ